MSSQHSGIGSDSLSFSAADIIARNLAPGFDTTESETVDFDNRALETIAETMAIPADVHSTREEIILSWMHRAAGIVSFISGVWMFFVAWKRRHSNVFHRLMLAMSVHVLVWSIWQIVGTAAVPEGTPDTHGAYGNTATCTAQGFFNQFSGMSIPFYYAFLSVYSWCVMVHANFNPTRYSWIEPYIHAAVHVFPIVSAIYLLSIDAFNFGGLTCYIASIPFGCGDDSGIECVRGPQNPSMVIWAAAGIPALFPCIFPTLVMITLVGKVCMIHNANTKANADATVSKRVPESQQRLFGMTPTKVCRQSIVYLGTIYWVYFPLYAYATLSVMDDIDSFGAAIAMSLTNTAMGFWIALVYWYFSFYGSSGATRKKLDSSKRTTATSDVTEHHLTSEVEDDYDFVSAPFTSIHKGDGRSAELPPTQKDHQEEQKEEQQEQSSSLSDPSRRSDSGKISPDKKPNETANAADVHYSFNIFDGTNFAGSSDSPFADYLFEGDDEDNADNQAETDYWAGCQQL